MCHEDVPEARRSPTACDRRGQCLECHADKRIRKSAATATRIGPSRTYPAETHTIIISHQAHLKLVNDDCTACHVKLFGVRAPGPRRPP